MGGWCECAGEEVAFCMSGPEALRNVGSLRAAESVDEAVARLECLRVVAERHGCE